MNVTVTSAPSELPLLLEEAKEHIQIDHDDDDNYISSLIRAATAYAEGYTKRKFITQTLSVDLNAREALNPIRLPYAAPLQSFTSLTEYDSAGNTTVVDSANYYTVGGEPAKLVAYDAGWNIYRTYKSHTAVYVVGYGDSGEDVPDDLIHALKVTVADLFHNTESVQFGTRTMLTPNEVPVAARVIYDAYEVRAY